MIAQLGPDPPDPRDVRTVPDGLISRCVPDDGDLVVAHVGVKEVLQGRPSGAVRSFRLCGEIADRRWMSSGRSGGPGRRPPAI